jgi:hypothetical protein
MFYWLRFDLIRHRKAITGPHEFGLGAILDFLSGIIDWNKDLDRLLLGKNKSGNLIFDQ